MSTRFKFICSKVFPWLASAAVISSSFLVSYVAGADPAKNLGWVYAPFMLLVIAILAVNHFLSADTADSCCRSHANKN